MNLNRLVVVDVESDGPLLGTNSMVCFGAVIVGTDKTFYGRTKPISSSFDPEALAISGFTRSQHLNFRDPKEVFEEFLDWISLNVKGKPILISDNNQYDGSWINWYFLTYIGKNPFGYSSRRIGDIFAGACREFHKPWKHLRDTNHSHHPVDDSKGNAEALVKIINEYGIK